MAKGRKKSSSKGCPEPLNTMIDLAGAAAMGAFAKHKIKCDYAKGRGKDSTKAAMMVYGMGAFRRGSSGLISLGGLYGINSALKDIEKSQKVRKLKPHAYDDGIDISFYKSNDNRYAWRLNCEDGSEYNVYPEDFESRDEYIAALREAKKDSKAGTGKSKALSEVVTIDTDDVTAGQGKENFFCDVSLLSNGSTKTFKADDRTLKRGDIVFVSDGETTDKGVVVAAYNLLTDGHHKPNEIMGNVIGKA